MKRLLFTAIFFMGTCQAASEIPWLVKNESDFKAKFLFHSDKGGYSITLDPHESRQPKFGHKHRFTCWDYVKVYRAHHEGKNLPHLIDRASFGTFGICPPCTATISLSGKENKYMLTVKRHANHGK